MSISFTAMREWFDRVKSNFDDELKRDIHSNACVFQVPRSLSSAKPHAYIPQLVGLGPYHHLQPQLLEMERVKLEVVKKFHKDSNSMGFNELSQKLSRLHLYICACYHKFLDIDEDMLLWIMTVDAEFLFHLLCQHTIGKKPLESSKFSWDLADHTGRKLAEDAILRDVVMLENQIPIFFLAKMVTILSEKLEDTEHKNIKEGFPPMLVGFCKSLSPLKETRKYPMDKALKCAHLLDLLYSMVVKREDEYKIDIPESDDIVTIVEREMEVRESLEVVAPPSTNEGRTAPQDFLSVTGEVLDILQSPSLPFSEKISPHAKMVRGIMKIISQQIGPSALDPFGYEEVPAEEKGLVPPASSLAKAGIKFCQTNYIEDISFDEKTHIFQLPAIKLGVNSEVVIRNLVAYEALAISGPLLFTRFVELMDGLLDTPHDVKLLKKHGIVTGQLKDSEVARLFNGMSCSIDVHGNSQLDKTIKKVNEFYNAAPNIKTQNMIQRYVYDAWKVLVLLATIVFFLLLLLQTFCSAYGCANLVQKGKKT